MTVYAQYEKDAAATYTVTTDADATVAYGSNSAQGTLADVPYGTQVTVSKAALPLGLSTARSLLTATATPSMLHLM